MIIRKTKARRRTGRTRKQDEEKGRKIISRRRKIAKENEEIKIEKLKIINYNT